MSDILNFLCFLGYLVVYYRFCEVHLEGTRMNRWFAAGTFFIVGCLAILFDTESGLPYICRAVLQHTLLIGLTFIFFQASGVKKLFAAAELIAVQIFFGNFVCSAFVCLALTGGHFITKGQLIILPPEWDELFIFLSYAAVILIIEILRRKSAPLFMDKPKKWYGMLAFILFLLVLLVDMVNWGASNGVLFVKYGSEDIFTNQIFSYLGNCLLTALAACIAGWMVYGMNRILLEQRKQEQYRAQNAYFETLNEQYQQMEGLRHDMKNHMLWLYGLWRNQEWERLGSYLEQMMEQGELAAEDEVTGSNMLDALLYQKRKQAKQWGIRWECDVQLPNGYDIEELDLCILFGNLLDNALKACKKTEDDTHRFVQIQAHPVKGCFLLLIKNRTDLKQGKNIRPHIGLWNVREAVEKYNGTLEFKVEENVFAVSVLLPEKLRT